jgi:hypothetical protein
MKIAIGGKKNISKSLIVWFPMGIIFWRAVREVQAFKGRRIVRRHENGCVKHQRHIL